MDSSTPAAMAEPITPATLGRGETDVAFAIAVILMVLVLLINALAVLAGKKLRRR